MPRVGIHHEKQTLQFRGLTEVFISKFLGPLVIFKRYPSGPGMYNIFLTNWRPGWMPWSKSYASDSLRCLEASYGGN